MIIFNNMKAILFFLLLISVTASAQLDSSRIRYNDQRGNIWFTVHNIPAWKIDGFNYAIRGSDTVARMRANGVFTAEELNILPNGSDMASQFENYVGLVNTVRLVSDSSRKFVINSALKLKGMKVIPENGNYFSGTGSIDSIIVGGGDYDRVFDTTLTITNPRSSTGHLTPQMFGAAGDGVTDDTKPLQLFAALNNQNLVLPIGRYKFSSALRIDSSSSFDGEKGLLIPTAFTGTKITIGSDSLNAGAINSTQGKYYYIRMNRIAQSNWSDSSAITDIGLRAKNLYRSRLEFHINGFTCNALLTGDLTNGGFTESNIYGSSTNAFKNVWYTRTGNGYFNSNTFHNISIRIDSDVNPGKRAYGFVAGTAGDGYLHNNNTVDGGSIQLNGNNRVALHLIYAYQSKFINWRNESNGVTAIVDNNSDQNIIRPGFTFAGTNIIDNSSGAYNVYEDPKDQVLTSANSYTVFEWSAAGNSAAYSGDGNAVRGIGMYSSTGTPITTYAPSSYLGIYPEFIRVKQTGLSIGVELSTATSKKFLIKHSHRDTAYGRALITMYDLNGAQLATTPPKMGGLFPTYNGAWGGGWLTGVNTSEDYSLNLPDSCQKVKIAFVGPTGNALDLKGVVINTVGPNRSNITPLFGGAPLREENISTGEPIWDGTYEVGKKINYTTPGTAGTLYWLTTVAGTNRTLTSASGNITSGSKELTVTGASIDSIYVGEYLNIGDIKYKVARKSSTKLYMTQAASADYSGAIDYYPAEFVEVKNAEASGSTGTNVTIINIK